MFRIFQEALTYVARHAEATEVEVQLAQEADGLVLRVAEACDGQETLEAARKQTWDVVLLDIKMPGRSGLEVLEELKKLQPKTPVVIISAFPEEEYALRAFRVGAAAYVSSEGASDELLAAVRKVLGGGRYVTPALAEKLAAVLSGETPAAPHEILSNHLRG